MNLHSSSPGSTRPVRALARRLARRLCRRAGWQSVLVALAVALPVGVGTVWAVVSATATPTPQEQLALFWGSANARLQTEPGPDGAVEFVPPLVADERLGQILPPSTSRAIDIDVPADLRSENGRRVAVAGRVLDLTDPLTSGMYRIDRGVAGRGGVQLSTALAQRLLVNPGEQVTVSGRPVVVDALLSSREDTARNLLVVSPAAVRPGGQLAGLVDAAGTTADAVGSARWLLRVPVEDIAEVERLVGAQDLGLVNRAEALNRLEPPPLVEAGAIAVSAVLLIEAALMSVAAFTVVVAGQRRNLGLLAAVGATAVLRRRVVRHYALLLAMNGAAAGALIGVVVALSVVPGLQRAAGQDWGPVQPAVGSIAVLVALAVGAALAAAAAPARAVARTPVVALLRGVAAPAVARSRTRRTVRRVLPFLATAVLLGSAAVTGNPLLLAAGVTAAVVLLAELGSALVAARSAHRSARLPPVARVALRSLGSVPTRLTALLAAAGMVAVLGGAVIVVAASVEQERSAELPPMPLGSALLTLAGPMVPAERAVVAAVRPAAYFASAGLLDPTDLAAGPSTITVASPMVRCLERDGQLFGAIDTSECLAEHPGSTLVPSVGIAEFADVVTLTVTAADPVTRSAYEAGAAVAVNGVVGRGATAVDLVRFPSSSDTTTRLLPVASVPVVTGSGSPQHSGLPAVYIAPATADKIGLTVLNGNVFVPATLPATAVPSEEIDRVAAAVPVRHQADLNLVMQGPENDGVAQARTVAFGAVVAATLVAATVLASGTALWNAESRPELSRIAVVGARRRWMVTYGAVHGAALAVLACAVALPPTVVAAAIFLGVVGVPPAVPFPSLLVLVICVVATSAAAGTAVTPRRGLLVAPIV